MRSVIRDWICLECLRSGKVEVCFDNKAKHLREDHADGLATPRDMIPVYESGEVDPRSCWRLLQVQKEAFHQALDALPRDHAEHLRRILDAVNRFLPEQCGGTPASEQG
jgi:hypothetical protein